jgi:hypothetical protein
MDQPGRTQDPATMPAPATWGSGNTTVPAVKSTVRESN